MLVVLEISPQTTEAFFQTEILLSGRNPWSGLSDLHLVSAKVVSSRLCGCCFLHPNPLCMECEICLFHLAKIQILSL
jgi:hypothetical protein